MPERPKRTFPAGSYGAIRALHTAAAHGVSRSYPAGRRAVLPPGPVRRGATVRSIFSRTRPPRSWDGIIRRSASTSKQWCYAASIPPARSARGQDRIRFDHAEHALVCDRRRRFVPGGHLTRLEHAHDKSFPGTVAGSERHEHMASRREGRKFRRKVRKQAVDVCVRNIDDDLAVTLHPVHPLKNRFFRMFFLNVPSECSSCPADDRNAAYFSQNRKQPASGPSARRKPVAATAGSGSARIAIVRMKTGMAIPKKSGASVLIEFLRIFQVQLIAIEFVYGYGNRLPPVQLIRIRLQMARSLRNGGHQHIAATCFPDQFVQR